MVTREELQVTAVTHHLSRASGEHGTLSVCWRFRNDSSRTLHVLVRRPLTIVELPESFVIDHSANDVPFVSETNMETPPKFIDVAAGTSGEHRGTYSIVLPPETATVRALGLFGYGDVPPDPSWTQQPNWQAMKKWQRVATSPVFVTSVDE